jgi:long-subunit acyl-CoA synthetase (AMP-forming)
MTTLCEAFQRTAAVDPAAVALRTVGGTSTLTWGEYAEQVRTAAAGLAGLGVARGDTIALMMANRLEFYPLDVAAQHLGATSFSVYNTLPAEQLAYLFTNAGNTVVVCEAHYVDRIRRSGVPIEHMVVLDGEVDGTITLDELYARGSADTDFDFDAAWRAVRPEDVATLIYTSGTTGNPKGVETTHANLMFEATSVGQVLDIRFGDRITSFLPSAHIADRFTALYAQIVFGTQVTVVSSPKVIAAALLDCRPTVWGAVPRVWEKLKQAIEHLVAAETDEARRRVVESALAVAAEKGALLLAGEPVPVDLEVRWAEADEAVLATLRATLGFDQLRWAISGAAPIPAATLAFFGGIGIPIVEIWGMSELSCICSIATPAQARIGTVGKLLPGMESRIADDGEFLVRGPLVMKGYRKEPEKTAEAIDPEGWLHTGDVMSVDEQGYLRIVDRKKELIINEAGKNLSPANIENALKVANPLLSTAVAIGDSRGFITALLVLDAEAAAGYAARRGIDAEPKALAEDPELIAMLRAGVAEGNAVLSRVEQIKRFRVVPAFWEPGGDEITLTMKLKRKPIAAKYADLIEELYTSPAGPGVHEPAS